jgi:hypothetical protein
MEAHGTLKSITHLHLKHTAVMEHIMMDNDSLSGANILQWDTDAAIVEGKLLLWPRMPAGKKKGNKGELLLSHPQWKKLANHNHHMRCLARRCFKLACAVKAVSLLTVADAERLKRNYCYTVHKFKTYDFPTFKRMIWAVLYPHFGVHNTCGDWCPWLRNKDNPKALENLFY